jgi:hypothetical protein
MRRPLPQLIEDDPTLFDSPPEWLLPELKRALRDSRSDDELGLRSLIEHPEALTGRQRAA